MATKAAANTKAKTPASVSTAKLVQSIADKASKRNLDVSKKEIAAMLDLMLETVSDEVRKGNRVSLKNFGVFRRHTKPARPKRMGRNPKTGEEITIPAKKAEKVVKFRPAKAWKEAVKAART